MTENSDDVLWHGQQSCAPTPVSALATTMARATEGELLKVLLVSRPTDHVRWTQGHPTAPATPILCKFLLDAGFDVELVNNFERIRNNDPDEGLPWFDVVVFHGKLEWQDDQALAALKSFVEGGKGLVVLHIASASFAPAGAPSAAQDWKDLVGSVFGYPPPGGEPVFSDHPPQGPIRVRLDQPEHPILRGVPNEFELDLDELYRGMVHGGDGPGERLASGTTPDGPGRTAHEPIAFVLERGRGRVFNLYPGHSIATHRDWRFQQMVTQGVRWCARQL